MHRLASYLKEREGFDSIVNEYGFIAYRIEGKECNIYDLFISPDYRRKNVATELAQQVEKIAVSRGCTHFTGTVFASARNATDSAKFILAYGLKIHGIVQNTILFRKEL